MISPQSLFLIFAVCTTWDLQVGWDGSATSHTPTSHEAGSLCQSSSWQRHWANSLKNRFHRSVRDNQPRHRNLLYILQEKKPLEGFRLELLGQCCDHFIRNHNLANFASRWGLFGPEGNANQGPLEGNGWFLTGFKKPNKIKEARQPQSFSCNYFNKKPVRTKFNKEESYLKLPIASRSPGRSLTTCGKVQIDLESDPKHWPSKNAAWFLAFV